MRRVGVTALLMLLFVGGFAWQQESAGAQGTRVCAVIVESLTIGPGGGRNSAPADQDVVVGEPDATQSTGYSSLGVGGSITLQLAAPGVSGDGTPNSDLFIYEGGTVAEFVFVEISTDGVSFEPVGLTGSQASGIDLDAAGIGPGTNYLFVRVTDDAVGGSSSGNTGGADIDAVCGTNTDNAPPVAVDDSATFDVGGDYTTNVLANDDDPDGDDLEIESFTQPDGGVGTVEIDGDGNATFVPTDPGFERDRDLHLQPGRQLHRRRRVRGARDRPRRKLDRRGDLGRRRRCLRDRRRGCRDRRGR